MKTKQFICIFLSILTLSCHKTKENAQNPIDKVHTVKPVSNVTSNIQIAPVDTAKLILQKKRLLPLITKILKTSPVFLKYTKGLKQAIIKNGGSNWELDFDDITPDNNFSDYLEKYTFRLYEIYPDHFPHIASFCFSTKQRQLYEEQYYDTESVPEGTLIPRKFDRKLLKEMDRKMR